MEWTLKEDRVAVIALHRCGYAPILIFDILKSLNITKRFVYRTIKRYNEDSSIDDRSRSCRPRSVRTPAVIKAVKARIQRNPKRKQKQLALQMGLSRTTVKRVLNEDLGFRAYRRNTGHRLNARLMDLRLKRCRYCCSGTREKYRENLFSDEKNFTVEESYNKQNDKVYAHSSEEAINRIPRGNEVIFPSSLMVWHGVFQQDSAPAHRAKSTQDWLAAREIDFIRHEDWPSCSSDLSPLDYKIWQHLEEKECSKPHPNLESLKTSLIKAAAYFDMDLVRAAIDD
ncbi:hypothetical protein evm_003005 [Chilo suppressalis]|nr:hypothetical protein evm_003005 [Chilo suppressalis]